MQQGGLLKTRYLLPPLGALLLCFPARLRAGCGSPPNDGWGANYKSYAAWCRACGGTPYSSPGVGCRPGSNWGGGAAPAADYGAEQRRLEEERLAEEAALRKKAARKKEQQEERAKQKEEEQRDFKRSQEEGLKNLKGVPRGGGLKGAGAAGGLKGAGDACVRDEDFESYHRREADRKLHLRNLSANLASGRTEKYRADWCKLNLPLPPSPQAAGYCEKKPLYEARLEEWRLKCSAVAAPLPPVRAAGAEKPQPRGDPADCLGAYDGEVKPCAAEGLRAAACLNKAVFSYLRCLTGEAPRVGSGN